MRLVRSGLVTRKILWPHQTFAKMSKYFLLSNIYSRYSVISISTLWKVIFIWITEDKWSDQKIYGWILYLPLKKIQISRSHGNLTQYMLSPASLQVAPRSIVRSKSHPMKPRSYKISILLRCVAQRRDSWEDVMYQDCQVAILMWSRGNSVTIDTASAPPTQYRRFNIKTVYSRLVLHKNIEY